MSLRVAHVVRQYSPSIGGLETVVARLASLQKSLFGHDVRIVTLDRVFKDPTTRLVEQEEIDGVPVTRLAWCGSPRYPICPQVIGHLKGMDLVHVHGIDFFYDWLALTQPIHGKRLLVSTHGGFFHTGFASKLKAIWFKTITRCAAQAYRSLIATSENDGAIFSRIASKKLIVIENGADVTKFHNASSPDLVRTILYFGRWSANKGLLELIEAFAALNRLNTAWRLIIAGRPYDISELELASAISSYHLDGAVELHASPKDEQLQHLMSRSSYFACLSRHEGFGIAAIEAMSAGLYPMLSDIPPFRKIVSDSGIGLLFASSSTAQQKASDIAETHALLFVRSYDRARMIDFTRRYEWTEVADRYEAAYREALI